MSDRHGCFNRSQYWDKLLMQDGWEDVSIRDEDGRRYGTQIPKFVEIPFRNSKDCMHPEKAYDPRCEGCKWIQNHEPAAEVTVKG